MPGSEQEQGQEWERIREPSQQQCSPPVRPPALRSPPWCAAIRCAAPRVDAAGRAPAPGCGTASFFPQSRKANTSAGSATDRRVSIVTGTEHPKWKSMPVAETAALSTPAAERRSGPRRLLKCQQRSAKRTDQHVPQSHSRPEYNTGPVPRLSPRTRERSPRPCAAPLLVPGPGPPAGQAVLPWTFRSPPTGVGTY